MNKKAGLWKWFYICLTAFAILTWILWFNAGGLGWTKGELSKVLERPKEILTKQETSSSCEENARKLIPEKLTLYQHGTWKIKDNFVWNDGSKEQGDDFIVIDYKKGSSTGQNINYFYPSALLGMNNDFLTYSKKVIDEQGNILGANQFSIKLILKPIPNTEGEWVLWDGWPRYKTQEFEVMNIEFISCNWVKNEK